MTKSYIVKEPTPSRRPGYNWPALLLELSENDPDKFVLLATNVNASAATHLRKRYGVEAVVRGERKGNLVAELYVKFITGTSTIGEKGEQIRARRDSARKARELMRAAAAAAAEKSGKSDKGKRK